MKHMYTCLLTSLHRFKIFRRLKMWSLVPLPFLNPACSSGSSLIRYASSLFWSTFSMILLVCEIWEIILWLLQSFLLSFLNRGINIDVFQSDGHNFLVQIRLQSLVITLTALSPPVLINSIGILSQPGDLPFDTSRSVLLVPKYSVHRKILEE